MAAQFRFDVTFDVKEVSGMLIATGREFASFLAAREPDQLQRLVEQSVASLRDRLATKSDAEIQAYLSEHHVEYDMLANIVSSPTQIRLPVVVGG